MIKKKKSSTLDCAWKNGEVSDDWKKAIIALLYKCKSSRSDYSNYRGINLLSVPGKVYERILTY